MDPKTVWNKILHRKEQCIYYFKGLCLLKADWDFQIAKPEDLSCAEICEYFTPKEEKKSK